MLAFLLLYLVITSLHLQGSHQQCFPVTDCTSSFKALRLIAYGVDLPTLDLFPNNGYHQKHPVKPVLKLTCNQAEGANSWVAYDDCMVPFPEQVANVRFKENPIDNETDQLLSPAFIEVIKGLGEYRDQLEESIGVGDISLGVMSLTEHFRDWQRWLLKEDKTAVYYEQPDYNTQVILKSPSELLSSVENFFIQSTQALRNHTFVGNSVPFEKLLSTFGTHYFGRVSFGRTFRVRCLFSDTYALSLSGLQLTTIANAYLNLTDDITLLPEVKEKFEAAQRAGVTFDFKLWGHISSWMIGGSQLEPISVLIEDEAVSEQVDLAIQSRLTKAALSEWKFSLQMIASNSAKSWILFPPAFAISKLIHQIDVALTEILLDESTLTQLKDKVTAVVNFAIFMKGNNPHSV